MLLKKNNITEGDCIFRTIFILSSIALASNPERCMLINSLSNLHCLFCIFQVVQGTVYFQCDMFVKSSFSFDPIFCIHEKNAFHFFSVQNLKWLPDQNEKIDQMQCPLSFMISRLVAMIFNRYQDMVTSLFYLFQVIQANRQGSVGVRVQTVATVDSPTKPKK